jgi:hypothetical protein
LHPASCEHAAPGHQHFPGVEPHQLIQPSDPTGDPGGDSSPAHVLELAAACVRFVATAIKIPPDFTPETLSLVDHYVGESRKALAERPEALVLTANAVGAYLGEVIKRSHRCWWRADDADPSGWRLEFESVLLAFYPMQVAYALLSPDGADDQFSGFELEEADRNDVIDRLAELPPVSEREYMLPSTRLEVLDIAVEALVAKHYDDPLAKRGYRPDDYASR